jgi:ribonucleoside-triphosphate reductase
MHVNITYDNNFDDLMLHLKAKYGQKLFDLDGIGTQLDIDKFSKGFFTNSSTTADVSVDSNSNVSTKDMIVYNTELPKPYFRMNAYYLIWKKLRQLYGHLEANRIIEMQLTGDFYINDFHGVSQPYCYNYSTYDIALNGLTMVNKIKSIPPKHLYSFKSQLEQFVVIASNSTLGACGLADLAIVMAYYVDNILETKSDAGFHFTSEADCWRYVKENLVSFIYTINQPSRASQSPFTNISIFDDGFLESLAGEYVFPDGRSPYIGTIKKLQELFIDTMNEELRRTPVTFPVTTACFSVDDDGNILDGAFLEMISEKNMEFGFINIYCGKTSTLSSCCRLRSDTNSEYFNSFGSGSTKIGSLGVVTVNLPRLAYRNKDNEEEFFAALEDIVEVVAKINNSKRHIIKRRIENGAQPLYSQGFMDIKKQYSTCGLNGINEAITIMGYDVLNNGGVDFGLKMLEVINKTNDRMQKKYDAPHNCEQTPSENSSIKLANKDKMLGMDLGYNLYSNQFIPLITKADLLDRIRLQGIFDKHFSGGAICHLNVEEQITEKEHIMELIRVCASKGVIYFAINYNLQRCEDYHMTVGRNGVCSVCGKPIEENFTRIVGFLTATSNWNKVRREEDYPMRQFYGGIN